MRMRKEVRFTLTELTMAGFYGVMRRIKAIAAGSKNKHGVTKNLWENDICGVIGEMAIYRALGIYWEGNSTSYKGPDLPNGFQVKTTSYSTGHLLLRNDDNPNNYYVLVIIMNERLPSVYIAGGIPGSQGTLEKYQGKPDPERELCWEVPQEQLDPDWAKEWQAREAARKSKKAS